MNAWSQGLELSVPFITVALVVLGMSLWSFASAFLEMRKEVKKLGEKIDVFNQTCPKCRRAK